MIQNEKGNTWVLVTLFLTCIIGIALSILNPSAVSTFIAKNLQKLGFSPKGTELMFSPSRHYLNGCFGLDKVVFSYWDTYTLAGKAEHTIVDSETNCYEVGKSYKAYAVRTIKFDLVIHYLYFYVGEVIINRKRTVELDKLDQEVLDEYERGINYKQNLNELNNGQAPTLSKKMDRTELVAKLKDSFPNGAIVYDYRFTKYDYTNLRSFFVLYPKVNNIAQHISGEEAAKFEKSSIVSIVTSEAGKAKKVAANPHAIIAMYNASSPTVRYSEIFDFGVDDEVNFYSLPNDRNAKLLIRRSNLAMDTLAFRTLIRLRSMGYKNLFWYRPPSPASFPKKEIVQKNSLKIIDHKLVKQMLSEGAQLIYSPVEFKNRQQMKIEGSIKAVYVDPREYKFYRTTKKLTIDDFIYEKMVASKEYFYLDKLPRDKNHPLIFYGRDKYDFTPYKAAVWANKFGWKNIYLYEGGEMTWASLRSIFGNDYKLIRQID